MIWFDIWSLLASPRRFCESKPSSSYPRKFLGCFIQQSSRSLTCSITVKLCIFNDMVRVQSTTIATVSRVQIPSRLRIMKVVGNRAGFFGLIIKPNFGEPKQTTTRRLRCETAFKISLCRLFGHSFCNFLSLRPNPSSQGNSILHARGLFVFLIKFDTFSVFLLNKMGYEPDPDALRWGLHDLEVCTLTNAGSCGSVTLYGTTDDAVDVNQGYVREGYNQPLTGYVDNDAVIAQFYQDELSRVERAEESSSDSRLLSDNNPSRISVVSQEWPHQGEAIDISRESDMEDKNVARIRYQGEGSSPVCDDDDSDCSVEVEEESWSLDSEVGKRLNQMIPIAHVPKINGELPSEDEQVSDHERLFQRLQLYGLVENKILGDGNCQFRSLSDQLYRSPEHHNFVREQVVNQLSYNREMYEGYVPMAYTDYLKTMKRNGEWGDHVTLQAAADWYGVRMFVITSFKNTCYIEILPHLQKSNRLICLSFWAEVHYNSIYPEGELPEPEGKKKKKYWVF
ncbi:Uncharacterized protein Rs2_12497 [Raphanus sativus]|nr:Uncharacterized protein Rs2_12497 [Raphanus sativus]